MSEKLLRFFLSELSLVRLVCQNKKDGEPCGAVIEVPIQRLPSMVTGSWSCCPVCKLPFTVTDSSSQDSLTRLARAVHDLVGAEDRVKVQFVLPQKD